MKSSTLRRSNLSRERIAVLEALAHAKKQQQGEKAGACQKQNKEKELDVLWQNFRVNQKSEKTPGVYLITGFIAGAVAMLIMTTLLSFSVNSTKVENADFVAPTKVKTENSKLTFIPADKKTPVTPTMTSSEAYTVADGDTLESIIIRFYGQFGLDKVEKIKQANNLANPNALAIGQKLIIPME